MKIKILPGTANGRITAPPSKSVSHRALICSYLAGGGSISNLADSADIRATRGALSALESGGCLDCGESGSTIRFLIPLCLTDGKKHTLCGTRRLFERDLSVYEQLCRERGFMFEKTDSSVTVCGKLDGGVYRVRGDISSQFITGLMLALPLTGKACRIEFTTAAESMPYILLTAGVMKSYGVTVTADEYGIDIPADARYTPCDYTIEGDWSNAAFFDALNLLGGEVEICGLDTESIQGDKIYREYFEELNECAPLTGISDYPDLAPILMAMMAAKHGGTLCGTHRLKIKESDRGAAMAEELAKFGVTVIVNEDSITVGRGIHAPGCELDGHNDHRIVMALATLCTVTGGVIRGAQAVGKSLPEYLEMLRSLGFETEAENED